MKQPLELRAAIQQTDAGPILKVTNWENVPQLAFERFGECELKILVVKYGKTRTSAQNRYYWGVCVSMIHAELQNLGNEVSPETVHDFLKNRWLTPEPISNSDGEQIGNVLPSTTLLTRVQFMEYLEAIKAWAADTLNIYIPDPNEEWEDIAEPVKIEGGIVIQPDTPETVAEVFIGQFILRTATDLNDARHQIINSSLSAEERRAAAALLSEKAEQINCTYNRVSMQYVGPVKQTA